MDKLTIDYLEDIIPTMAHKPFDQRIAKQLVDTMRENDSLLQAVNEFIPFDDRPRAMNKINRMLQRNKESDNG